jgi:hypothetical protein
MTAMHIWRICNGTKRLLSNVETFHWWIQGGLNDYWRHEIPETYKEDNDKKACRNSTLIIGLMIGKTLLQQMTKETVITLHM